jgi:quinol monooxygenase YgiN
MVGRTGYRSPGGNSDRRPRPEKEKRMNRNTIGKTGRRDALKTVAGLSLGVALPAGAHGTQSNGPGELAAPRRHAGGASMEISIRADRDIATLINVFVVDPDHQEQLIQVLKEGTETLFRKQPGYIAASFHKSQDGRRVINYGQWRSPKDIEAFRGKPEIGEYFKRVRALAQYEAVVCDVAYVDHA